MQLLFFKHALGKERIAKIYDLADIYHSDNIERVSDDFIEAAKISVGNFDNVRECQYAVPSHWDIGKVYKRLIKQVALEKKIDVVDAIIEAYHSFFFRRLHTIQLYIFY